LQKLYKEIQQQNLQQQIGKTYKVFFDDLKPDKKILGKCNNYFTVLVEGSEELLNQQKKVKITHIEKGSLIGEII
jgi:tRNA-2-methylthio-N6-dimethylallyladenosine synthase